MKTSYEYEFVRDIDPKRLCMQLSKSQEEEGWEPVGFSIAPSSGEYVVLVRREPPSPDSTFGEANFDSRDVGL